MHPGRGAGAQPSVPDRLPYIVFGAPSIGEEEIAEVTASLRSGWIGTGPKVARFEDMMCEFTGARYAVALNSCTAALHLSLLASGVGPGDEVITTAMTFAATVNAIVHTGATPVLVDCERDTQLIDPQRVAEAVTPRTRAIVPVHLAGRICDLAALREIASRHALLLVEDAAHALEGRFRGQPIGGGADLACFSFYVTKNATTGEGGVVTTSDRELADRIKMYGLHGMSRDAWRRFSDTGYRHYEVHVPGFKYNMMDIQAAIGIHQLPRVEAWLGRREEIWRRYDEAFAGLPVRLPPEAAADTRHARHLYTIMIDEERCGISRDGFMAALHGRGVGTGVHYRGVHLHAYYRERFGFSDASFPNASWISHRTVSLPLSPGLRPVEQGRVIRAVREAVEGA